jgi:hypothetical protein
MKGLYERPSIDETEAIGQILKLLDELSDQGRRNDHNGHTRRR